MRPLMTRRNFLRLALVAGIGVGAAVIQRNTAPVGPVTYVRWLVNGYARRFWGAPAVVALGECPSYTGDVLACLREAWRQAEMPDVRGKRILIKPNLVDVVENHPATTAPEVAGAVVDLLQELGASQVTVGDGPAFRRDAVAVAGQCGLLAALAARGVRFVDLNYDDPRPVPVNDSWLRRSPAFWLPRHVLDADLIVSVPKLKTHHWAGVSLSVKNLLGVVPGSRYGWPKNIIHVNNFQLSILGVYRLLPPVVAVIDGIVGMEDDGPIFGRPVAHGLLAVGSDPIAVDITCMQLMGFSIKEIEYLSIAAQAGLGQAARIETRGAARERLQRQYMRPVTFPRR